MKPYIICHMVASIDGRIDCSMVDKISGDEYYSTLEDLECPSYIEGKVTTEHYHSLPGHYQPVDATSVAKEVWYKATSADGYQICPDTNGTLRWSEEREEPLLVLLCEKVPVEYLDYLRERKISYIVTGKDRIDLARAMEILGKEFAVERMSVLGGGRINGGFLRTGLIDEISLLLAPGVDGRSNQPSLFEGVADCEKFIPTKLKLKSAETVGNGVLWIRYSLSD